MAEQDNPAKLSAISLHLRSYLEARATNPEGHLEVLSSFHRPGSACLLGLPPNIHCTKDSQQRGLGLDSNLSTGTKPPTQNGPLRTGPVPHVDPRVALSTHVCTGPWLNLLTSDSFYKIEVCSFSKLMFTYVMSGSAPGVSEKQALLSGNSSCRQGLYPEPRGVAMTNSARLPTPAPGTPTQGTLASGNTDDTGFQCRGRS